MELSLLDQIIRDYSEREQQSGVLRVTHRDRILFEESYGYADRENKVPFTENSLFTFYSLSKPFCALGFLKLKDRGLVKLEDHPAKFVPELAGIDPRVTFRHLLQHTSGLVDFGQSPEFKAAYAPGNHDRYLEHLKLLKDFPQRFVPGTEGYYANINFSIPAFAIEKITGMPYAEYMKREVFELLGMKTAFVEDTEIAMPNRVTGYKIENDVPVPTSKSCNWMFGGGDIVGRVEDVYCLNKAIKNKLLVSEETWEEILTPSPLNKKGMGCTVTVWHGKRRITHNGGHVGFRTLHIQLPEDDLDIIWLSNCGYGEARKFISERVYEAFYGSDHLDSDTVEMDKGYI